MTSFSPAHKNETETTETTPPLKTSLKTVLADGTTVQVVDDRYSDRVRCDHPDATVDGQELAKVLKNVADRRDRGRIVALVDAATAEGLATAGFREEAQMPSFYNGERDCLVMGAFPDPGRGALAAPSEVRKVEKIVASVDTTPRARPDVVTELATTEDAEQIAELLASTFPQYPTPSGDPDYITEAIEDGAPFRVVRTNGDVVACASADLVPVASTAELTDCATLPSHRGQGYMQAILMDLMEDLRELDYPTAFTLARARIPGVNIAFSRLGFVQRGTMAQSCRIGQGIEDMFVWSRTLAPDPVAQGLG